MVVVAKMVDDVADGVDQPDSPVIPTNAKETAKETRMTPIAAIAIRVTPLVFRVALAKRRSDHLYTGLICSAFLCVQRQTLGRLTNKKAAPRIKGNRATINKPMKSPNWKGRSVLTCTAPHYNQTA